jgi:hypothetical protein
MLGPSTQLLSILEVMAKEYEPLTWVHTVAPVKDLQFVFPFPFEQLGEEERAAYANLQPESFWQEMYDVYRPVDAAGERGCVERLDASGITEASNLEEFTRAFESEYKNVQITMDRVPNRGMFMKWHKIVAVLVAAFPCMQFTSYAQYGRVAWLVIFSFKKGNGTGVHLDFSPAVNGAFALGWYTVGTILAIWLIITNHPGAIDAVNAYILKRDSEFQKRRKGRAVSSYVKGIIRPPALVLDEQQQQQPLLGGDTDTLKRIQMHFGTMTLSEMRALHKACPAYVTLVEQRHGDVVVVPSGMPHAVWNTGHAHMKIAADRLVLEQLAQTALFQTRVGSKVFAQRNAEDYTSLYVRKFDDLEDMLNYYA